MTDFPNVSGSSHRLLRSLHIELDRLLLLNAKRQRQKGSVGWLSACEQPSILLEEDTDKAKQKLTNGMKRIARYKGAWSPKPLSESVAEGSEISTVGAREEWGRLLVSHRCGGGNFQVFPVMNNTGSDIANRVD